MKSINLIPKLNRTEKAVLKVLERVYRAEYKNNDYPDLVGLVKKEFIKLKKEVKDLIIFKEDINIKI